MREREQRPVFFFASKTLRNTKIQTDYGAEKGEPLFTMYFYFAFTKEKSALLSL